MPDRKLDPERELWERVRIKTTYAAQSEGPLIWKALLNLHKRLAALEEERGE